MVTRDLKHGRRSSPGRRLPLGLLILICAAGTVQAQGLRFSNRREVAIPDYATLRIGPFYSSMAFSQSAGYRYTRSSGAGTDYLYENERGTIRDDGYEFPLVSRLTFRNYLIITRNMDLDLSLWSSYYHYPMDTQEDDFNVDIAEEGLTGTLSTEFALSPYIRGSAYENAVYRTDYVDARGFTDEYGGDRYEYFRNNLGLSMDWLLAKDKNLGFSASRLDVLPQDDDDFDDQERYAYRESLVYEQEIFPDLITGFRASYVQTEYEDPARTDTSEQNYSAYFRFSRAAEGGAGFRLTDVTTLTATLGTSLGYTRSVRRSSDDDDDTAGDQERLSGSVKIETQLMRNVKHSFEYDRGLTGGFDSAFNEYDTLAYRFAWSGYATKLQLYSTLREITPDGDDEEQYSDWKSGLSLSYPLTRYISTYLTSDYTVRDNADANREDEDEDDEVRYDYDTWRTRLGTSFGVTKEVNFNAYAEHIERISDASTLEYERDTVAATLTYSHQF